VVCCSFNGYQSVYVLTPSPSASVYHWQVWDDLSDKVAQLSVGQLIRLRQVQVKVKSSPDSMYLDMRPSANSWFQSRGLEDDSNVRDTRERLSTMTATAVAADAADKATVRPAALQTTAGAAASSAIVASPRENAPSQGARASVDVVRAGASSRDAAAVALPSQTSVHNDAQVVCTRVTSTKVALPITYVAVALAEPAPKKYRLRGTCTDVLPDDRRDFCRALCKGCSQFQYIPDVPCQADGEEDGRPVRRCPTCT
jgi:hypothetical protein